MQQYLLFHAFLLLCAVQIPYVYVYECCQGFQEYAPVMTWSQYGASFLWRLL